MSCFESECLQQDPHKDVKSHSKPCQGTRLEYQDKPRWFTTQRDVQSLLKLFFTFCAFFWASFLAISPSAGQSVFAPVSIAAGAAWIRLIIEAWAAYSW
mmetsp:Transcript_65015/g.172105  ORF Transcript_65015/g.172105 Transcript_65015/m.172105 type:complete len:99 (+) Transcript_65015:357-653(+)